jgi:hypothetical protein
MEENIGEIVLRKTRADGLIMSRVPKRIRDNFIKLSEDEFAGDYGMALAFLWNNFELWTNFMQNWDIKLNYIINKLENKTNNQPAAKKMLSGKEIILKGGTT